MENKVVMLTEFADGMLVSSDNILGGELMLVVHEDTLHKRFEEQILSKAFRYGKKNSYPVLIVKVVGDMVVLTTVHEKFGISSRSYNSDDKSLSITTHGLHEAALQTLLD